jgi:hypothetical protein
MYIVASPCVVNGDLLCTSEVVHDKESPCMSVICNEDFLTRGALCISHCAMIVRLLILGSDDVATTSPTSLPYIFSLLLSPMFGSSP